MTRRRDQVPNSAWRPGPWPQANLKRATTIIVNMSGSLLEIDGSFGEGGGQILRTSLALSLLTGRPFRLYNIRAGRSKPGLQPQHLTSVQAAATIGQAKLRGASRGSSSSTSLPYYQVQCSSSGTSTSSFVRWK